MILRRAVALLIPLLLAGPYASAQLQAAPTLVSVFPLGGQRGKTLEVEIRGTGLKGAYAVWLGAATRLEDRKSPRTAQGGIRAHVKAIPDDSRVKVQLVIASDARIGFHTLGLITPGGLSGTIPFWVGPEAVIQESAALHKTPATAQPVKLPVAINGRISASGQLAYYTFTIPHKQTVAFEVIAFHGAGFDPQLALYEAGGSYLDSRRFKRLLFHEEVTLGSMPANRRMTYHFRKPGRYLVNLGNLFARGGADSSYLLRIAPVGQAAAEDAVSWAKRRLAVLRSRTVGAPAIEVALVGEAKVFKVPAVLEGTIGHAGDIDRFRFKAKAGQKLVFEIQTPRATAPHFNPRLDVLDAKGTVVLTNLQVQKGKIGTEDARVIQVASPLMGKLDREGDYSLRVRDLTSIHGSPDHLYRILVRPQIPHIGDIRLFPDGPVNLLPGARHRLTLNAPAREGYAGTLALCVEGLPQGVRAFVGANNSVIELVADANAPSTPMPQVLRISGLPLLGGKSGSPFPVREIPIMVIKK